MALKKTSISHHLIIIWALIIICAIISSYYSIIMFTVFPMDSTSSLYLLSALAQSQAAIFAIAITLNLIGMQLTTAIYSLRVVDVFAGGFKSLWGLYGISIFYDIILMNLLPSNIGKIHYLLVIVAIFLSMLAYISIFLQVNSTIDLLNPSNIVKKISKKNDSSSAEQMYDFIVGSIKKNDFSSYRSGLSELSKVDKNGKTIENVVDIFLRVGMFSISIRNEEATTEVIKEVGNVYLRAPIDKRDILSDVIQGIEDLGKYSARNRLEYSTIESTNILFKIVETFPRNIFEERFFVEDIYRALSNIGRISSEMDLENSTVEVVNAIDSIIENAIVCSENIHTNTIRYLGKLGVNFAENKLETSTQKIVVILEKIAINSINQKTDIMSMTIDKIGQISLICAKNGFEEPIFESVKSFETISENLSVDKIDCVNQMSRWVEMVRKCSVQNGFENIAQQLQMSSILLSLSEHCKATAIRVC